MSAARAGQPVAGTFSLPPPTLVEAPSSTPVPPERGDYRGELAWLLAGIIVAVAGQGIMLEQSYQALDSADPETGEATGYAWAAIVLVVPFGVCAFFLRPRRFELVAMAGAAIVGVLVGLGQAETIGFEPDDEALGSGEDTSTAGFGPLGVLHILVMMPIALATLAYVHMGQVRRIWRHVFLGIEAALGAGFAAIGIYMLANMDRLAKEAFEAHQRDTYTPGLGLVAIVLVVLVAAFAYRRARS